MTFHPIKSIKESPLTILFWMFVGYVAFSAVDGRTGGAISSRLKSLPVLGGLL